MLNISRPIELVRWATISMQPSMMIVPNVYGWSGLDPPIYRIEVFAIVWKSLDRSLAAVGLCSAFVVVEIPRPRFFFVWKSHMKHSHHVRTYMDTDVYTKFCNNGLAASVADSCGERSLRKGKAIDTLATVKFVLKSIDTVYLRFQYKFRYYHEIHTKCF